MSVGLSRTELRNRIADAFDDRQLDLADVLMPEIRSIVAAALDPDRLRDVLRAHHPVMRSETGPFSGCRCGQVRLGEDVIAHVVAELVGRR